MRILSSGVFNAPLRHGSPILREHNSPEDLSEQTIQALNQITHDVSYPEAALIFGEGQDSRGVYVLCEGMVKLTNANCDGKTFIMKIAQPGAILGLHDVVTGNPYSRGVAAVPARLHQRLRLSSLHQTPRRHVHLCDTTTDFRLQLRL